MVERGNDDINVDQIPDGSGAADVVEEQRSGGLTGGYGGDTGVGNERTEDSTAGSTTPDDLGSTDLGPGLTAGGMGTSIDAGIEESGGGVSDPEALGMGMDDSTGMLDNDTSGGTQA
jgi:hypothetical protein